MMGLSDGVVFTWIGHLGVVFYVGSYAALQSGLIRGSSYAYAVLNLIAASLVLVSLTNAFNAASALIQVFWIAISLIGITRIFVTQRRNVFSTEERQMLDDLFSSMPAPMARRFMSAGQWSDLSPGTILTTENEPVETLHYILSGQAIVRTDGHVVGDIPRGFVGELNVLTSGPASATVEITAASRVFGITGEAIRALCKADDEIRLHVEQWLRTSIGRKLMEANARLSGSTGPEQKPFDEMAL
jgi:CRP-like cAMP-binding protein